jgi:regulator of RNase E activity RraA
MINERNVAPMARETWELFRRASVEAVWGALVGRGYPDQFMTGLAPINPDHTLVGVAVTTRHLPKRSDLIAEMQSQGWGGFNQKVVEMCEPGDVFVSDCGGTLETGLTGDVTLTRLMVRGGAGFVVDGAMRDIAALRRMDLPVYCKGAHAGGQQRRLVGADLNVPINCGGVTVLPGDVLVGDAVGIVVVPRALAEEVAEEAAATEEKEAFLCRKLIEDKVSLLGVYPPSPEVLEEYEAYRRSKADEGPPLEEPRPS